MLVMIVFIARPFCRMMGPLDLNVPAALGSADCIQCCDCITACTRGGITRTIAFPAQPETHVPQVKA